MLLLFGGESSEHDISISSARNVYAAIDDDKYEVFLGYIDRHGKWWLLDSFDMHISTHGAPQLLLVPGNKSFVTMPEHKVIKPDVILPILHGHGGEDGSVQGLAQLLHLPIVGSDVVASAIGMDKLATKSIASAHGIQVVPYAWHHAADDTPDMSKLSLKFGSPLFVKPTRSGSSVGVSKVHDAAELAAALQEAHRYHSVALIEKAIKGKELEVAVRGTKPNHQVSGVGEIVTGDTFYSYDDKYASGSAARVIIPAEISDETKSEIQNAAKQIYELLNCSGLARVDFFLSDDGVLYFNEINTLPGFTNISMYPKLWRHEGISYSQLIEHLIDDAPTRGRR